MAGWDVERLEAAFLERQAASKKYRSLDRELSANLDPPSAETDRASDAAARRVIDALGAVCTQLSLEGEVRAFGSFSSGLKRGTSDLDCSLMTPSAQTKDDMCEKLSKIMEKLPASCKHVTKVFLARTPLIKFVDAESGLEVDFCINNLLGLRNTLLLSAYFDYDVRVRQVARFVKNWANANDIVGTPEGFLNSYGYMLLVIFFLQQCSPPVLPHNLQNMATNSVPVDDFKWGHQDKWETKFVDDVGPLSRSANSQSAGELLVGFFFFYIGFEWAKHAVALRESQPGTPVDKFSLPTPTFKDQWYIEDPFDLRHNLACQCTAAGKRRILYLMGEAGTVLANGGSWVQLCPASAGGAAFLRCRVTRSVTAEMMLEEFAIFGMSRLHFPRRALGGAAADDKFEPQVFLEFPTAEMRRAAHCRNEDWIGGTQVSMVDSTVAACREAAASWQYEVIEARCKTLEALSMAAAAAPLPCDDDSDLGES